MCGQVESKSHTTLRSWCSPRGCASSSFCHRVRVSKETTRAGISGDHSASTSDVVVGQVRTPGVRLTVRRLFVLCLLCANPWTGFGVTSVGYTLISRSPISEMGKPTLATNLTVNDSTTCTAIVECTYGSGGVASVWPLSRVAKRKSP